MSTSPLVRPAGSRRAAALLLPLLLGACATTTTSVQGGGEGLDRTRIEPYDGPRARIAVAAFEDRTAKGGGEIGSGMATMLTTALVNSSRYIVLERDALDEVLREQDLGDAGRVRAETAVPSGEIEGAELLAIGAVTAFEPESIGVGGGILGLGTLIGTAILHESNQNIPIAAATYLESHIAIDVRLVDAVTSRVLFTTSVEAKGYNWGGSVIAEVGGGRSRLPLAFGGFQKTATEAAVRKAIDLAVVDLARRTPSEYFRHRAEEFTSGRMAAFAYLDVAGLTGERFAEQGLRVASTPAEWGELAAALGLGGPAAEPPVDFSVQRVAAVFAGAQPGPGRSVSVEKAVAYPDRVELTAALLPAPPGAEKLAHTPALLRPMALVRLEQGAPVSLAWETR
jgi:curli biogenesis system outer membrane secretion channel CsgG